MSPAGSSTSFAVRFRAMGPWRFGPDSGARDRVGFVYHSDAVFSAVCSAMLRLGLMEDWLRATATSEDAPAVRFSSFFPYHGDTLLVIPPRSLWPPAESAKIRYKGARFVPLGVVESLVSGKGIDEDRWSVDGESECLVSHGAQGPFRIAIRSSAGVDRLEQGNVTPHATACLEFARNSGLWVLVEFASAEAAAQWEAPVRSAFRLLADSGFGGERSRGWGRAQDPEWQPWTPPGALSTDESGESGYWLLSVFTPAARDTVDWTRGSYSTIARAGRIESTARWGEPKAATTMVAEGSVLLAAAKPQGAAQDIAPSGFPHPVYRAGFAVTVPIPWRAA
ncbi:MAG TPA: type III-A CRISPR-associated RAMP protein Csm4 [Bryobacteraceae bacterium]|nr:type III-A CRISPR-associated RAMP protein Csm4 [Bryobacteraceae bacterium]